MTLSEFLIQKAKNELREDESRKEQSIELFKEWLLKHPFIKVLDEECLTSKLLLPFLRSRKYQMDKVYESVEKALLFVKHNKLWCYYQDDLLQRALDLYDNGFLLVSKDYDADGRRVIVCTHKMDIGKHNADDVYRLFTMTLGALSIDEQTQISGIVYVNDCRHVTMNYVSLFSIKHFYNFAMQSKSAPMRLKKILGVGLPPITNQLLKVVRLGFTEKLNKRMMLVDSLEDVSKEADVSILTKEYGGKFTEAELIDDFRPTLIEYANFSRVYDNFEVDFESATAYKKDYDADICGTFRKLEID